MSDCGFCISGGDCDGIVEMLERDHVKARKMHKCGECRRDIQPGSEYERTSFKWEGKFETYHVCFDCAEIREAFDCSEAGEALIIGEMWSYLEQNFASLTTGCLANLETASAKAYLLERWNRWKGLSANPAQ